MAYCRSNRGARNCMDGRKLWIALVMVLGAIIVLRPAHAEHELLARSEHTAFSETLQFVYNDEPRALRQTGQAIRKQLFMQIYAMAHYLEASPPVVVDESAYDAIIDHPGIKQITMVFLRSLSASQIRKTLLSSLRSNASKDDFESMQPDIDRFMSAIDDDVKRGDEFVLRWYPDGTLDSLYQGIRVSSIENARLAGAMWSIWFGEGSAVDRAALVERL